MAIGNIISADDFNSIRNKIVPVIGPGSGNSGYGQTVRSSAVSAGNIVTKAQWDNLRFDIYNALIHQTGTVPSITDVAANSVIRFGASQPNFQYDTLATTAVANRFNLGTGRFATLPGATASRSFTWATSATATITVAFSTADQARFFFNSGGKIRFTSSLGSDGESKAQNTSWINLLSGAGTQQFAGNTPAVNFYTLTSSYQTWFTTTATSPYASNNYRLDALCNVANNSTGTATSITFRATWTDGYVDPGPGGPPFTNDGVNGTLTLTADQIKATGDILPSGLFTIAGPSSIVASTITGS
jgi:hypothetical protein